MTESIDHKPPFDVARTLDGKSILIIGTTGFVGKVMLSMLLRRYPNIGTVYAVVRPGMGNTAEERFFGKVAPSPAFDPLREVWGDGFEGFLRDKVVPIPGDIGRPLCNFDDELFDRFQASGGIDCIVNSAGLVSFTPSLENALRINARGAQNVLEAARKAGANLVHVSTCFVAGRRDGEVHEDEPVLGYFPRRDDLLDDDFSAEDEVADCQRIIDQVRERANDRAHISEFRERAAATLEAQRRDPDDKKSLRLAVARERKLWMARKLVELGKERAAHWGWTNTYTYTKSLGEQLILADDGVRSTIVRPAVVESAVRYPFAGWNEGFNTTAPLVYLTLKGHRQIVAAHKPLDLIPVDLVAAGMIAATAAIIDNRHKPVYQLGTSAVNPVMAKRLVELTGLAVRRHYREQREAGIKPLESRIRARLEPVTVDAERFENRSAPRFGRLARSLSAQLDKRLPKWGAPRLTALAERAKDELGAVVDFTSQVTELVELFKPFTYDCDIRFRADNMRELCASMTPHDQLALPWDPEAIDWRRYWFDVHFPGLQKWVFPVLDDEFGAKPRSVYTYKDLLELFHSATKLHRHRVAMRLLPTRDDDAEPSVYTYDHLRRSADSGASTLGTLGVHTDDRVLLASENRPEWAISYFAVLQAGASAVPVDWQLSIDEIVNVLRASGAKHAIMSDKVASRLVADAGAAVPSDDDRHDRVAALFRDRGLTVRVVGFEHVLSHTAVDPPQALSRRGSSVASLIYTSGTTGDPKGVMLSHKNLTAMAAKLSSIFKLYRHDGLLSVLPLHHTFEFSAGLLMPLIHGSSITYLDEIDSDGLTAAFREGGITGMVGVPALWKLLHRKIYKSIADRGPVIQRLFDSLVELNRGLRNNAPFGWNLGKLLFYPIHRRLGGRQRLLISGGSALSVDVLKSFVGLGFKMVEGYGMTEAAPVLTVMRPSEKPVLGSVGRALPGVAVEIADRDERGVGEVVAKGPNVMLGYYQNEVATKNVLRDGWLHTGDLGRIDDDGNLFIVGRKKEMILGSSGENVYPDELEEIYLDNNYVKELSIVGLPAADGETVAALVVPDYEGTDLSRTQVRERVRDHMRDTSATLPLYKRVRVFHLWDYDLPKTATRKVKRREVVRELERLERAAGGDSKTTQAAGSRSWVRDVVARVTQRPQGQITPDTHLDQLGFDSLMFTELGVALEAAGITVPDPGELNNLATVGDVERFVHGLPRASAGERAPRAVNQRKASSDLHIPGPLVTAGRHTLEFGQRMLYEKVFDTRVTGTSYVPPTGGFIVAANHASHLDMGLVKHALGDQGDLVRAMAARDYFFEDPIRKAYFENFTNLVPMERYGSLRESLRMAAEVIEDGEILLIFPEGTRSTTGLMADFKASLGYLAQTTRCGILPVYLAGTHDALPKGSWVPKHRDIAAHIGPFVGRQQLDELAHGCSRSESYRRIASDMERRVRSLAPEDYAWTLGEAGRLSVAEFETRRDAPVASQDGSKKAHQR